VSIPATLMSIEFEELVELFGTHLSRYRGGGPGTQLEESGLQNNALRAQFGGLRSYPIGGPSPSAKRAFNSSSVTMPPTISPSRTVITGTTEFGMTLKERFSIGPNRRLKSNL